MPCLRAAGDAELHYEVEGDGALVILVHGGTGTGAHDWEFQRTRLAERHRVVTLDLRGHGRSSDPRWLLGVEQIGEDVVALIDELGGGRAAIVGFSVGATAMLRLVCERSDVARCLVAIGASATGHPERVDGILSGPWPRALRELRHEHGGEQHWRRLRERLAESWATDHALTAEDLRAVQIPALVACGDRDRVEPVETALWLARTLPRGELLVLPDCGHFASRERPHELNAAIEGFLDRHAS